MPTEPSPQNDADAFFAEALYALRPAVVKAIQTAVWRDDAERVRRLIQPLHYTDVADLLERLSSEERQKVVVFMRGRLDPDVLPELDHTVREEVMEQLGTEGVVAAITELDSDDAVEIFDELDEATQQEILEVVPAEERVILEEGMAYPEDSAGRLMQRELVSVPSYWTVGETIDYLREDTDLPDEFYDLFVVDPRHRPIGSIPLNRLLRRKRPVRVRDIMETDMKLIPVDVDQEEVAMIFRQHDLVSAPVVDGSGRLLGVITIDDVVDVIDEEYLEDFMHLGGVHGDDLYRAALDTTRARFSWLLLNLGTAVLASVVIGFFEGTIEKVVALAVLMPIVASMGGNAGTQSLSVAVRALAMHELTTGNALRFVWKETIVGGINGILFALLTGLIAGLWFSNTLIGLVIAAAMIINLLVAGLAGTLIPLGLQRRGIDPAVASTVFLTTVTDVVGFFAFLGLAALVLL